MKKSNEEMKCPDSCNKCGYKPRGSELCKA